jgi:hypothetical protein
LFDAESVFFVVQEIVEVHSIRRNLSQGGVCYIVIQILQQSKGRFLMEWNKAHHQESWAE